MAYSGRVVSNFVNQALKGEDLVIYGDGSFSRSLQYVHDLIDGMILLVRLSCRLLYKLCSCRTDEFGSPWIS